MIKVDASSEAGGKGTAPSPISYVLSALISSLQVTAQIVAKDFGAELRGLEFDIEASLDTAVFIGGAQEGNPNIQDVIIKAIVETNMSDDLFEKLHSETTRRSPIYQLFFRSGTNITAQWIRRSL